MNNIRIDDEIINHYLNGEDLTIYRNDEIFSLGNDETGNSINVFTEPNYALIEKAKLITHGFIEEIKKLNLSNDDKILKYIPNVKELESHIIVKLVAGLPYNMRRMFRGGDGSNIIIVIDVVSALQMDDSNDLYIEEFANYIKYAVLLMILDVAHGTEDKNPVKTLGHAIFTASFAEYLSESNQLEKLDMINVVKFLESLEYQVIKKVLKKKRESDVNSFMGIMVNSNPEMITLGITGKRYLDCFDDENIIFEIYQKGEIEFLKSIVKNPVNKKAILLPNIATFINRAMIILTAGYIAWSISGIIFGEHLYNQIFYIYPLVIFVTWLLRSLIAYKLEIKNIKQFFITGIIIAILSIAYMLIVL